MSADLEQLEARLAELKGKRSAVDVTMTKQDLVGSVGEYMRMNTATGTAANGSDCPTIQGVFQLTKDARLGERPLT